MKLVVIFILLLCIISISSIAETATPPPTPNTFVAPSVPQIDYSSPDTYNEASFWENPDFTKIQWDQVTDQSIVPAQYINQIPADKIRIEEVTDRTKITSDQWGYGENLNKAEDLSNYPEAQKAVSKKYPSYQKIDLSKGSTTYKNGVLENDGVEVDLNDKKLEGTEVTALEGGGFAIGKGSSTQFSWGGHDFDLDGADKPVQLRALGQIILPTGAKMVNVFGTEIRSFDDLTTISFYGGNVEIRGIATFKDKDFEGFVGQEGDIKISGKVNIDQSENGENRYTLDNTALYRSKGFNYERVDQKMSGDRAFIADGTYYENVIKSCPNCMQEGIPVFEQRWQDVLPGAAKDLAKDAARAAATASVRYIKENPGKVLQSIQKNQKIISSAAMLLYENGASISSLFTGDLRIGLGGGGAGVVFGDAGIYVSPSGTVTGIYNIDENNRIEVFRKDHPKVGSIGSVYRYGSGKVKGFVKAEAPEDFRNSPRFALGLQVTFSSFIN